MCHKVYTLSHAQLQYDWCKLAAAALAVATSQRQRELTLSSCHLTASACVPEFSGPPDSRMAATTSSTAQPCIATIISRHTFMYTRRQNITAHDGILRCFKTQSTDGGDAQLAGEMVIRIASWRPHTCMCHIICHMPVAHMARMLPKLALSLQALQ